MCRSEQDEMDRNVSLARTRLYTTVKLVYSILAIHTSIAWESTTTNICDISIYNICVAHSYSDGEENWEKSIRTKLTRIELSQMSWFDYNWCFVVIIICQRDSRKIFQVILRMEFNPLTPLHRLWLTSFVISSHHIKQLRWIEIEFLRFWFVYIQQDSDTSCVPSLSYFVDNTFAVHRPVNLNKIIFTTCMLLCIWFR